MVCGGALGFVFPLSPEIDRKFVYLCTTEKKSILKGFQENTDVQTFNNLPRSQKQLIKVAFYCNSNALNNICIVMKIEMKLACESLAVEVSLSSF